MYSLGSTTVLESRDCDWPFIKLRNKRPSVVVQETPFRVIAIIALAVGYGIPCGDTSTGSAILRYRLPILQFAKAWR